MPRDDVAFGFDPRPFMKGLGVVTKGLGELTKKVTGVAGQITRRLLLIGVAVKGAQLLWRKFNQYVPEFGKAMNIAGDIFFKNFFWPLRRMLVPLLQSLLDWVRDHRTTFIKWGMVLTNVITAVIKLGKQMIGIFRTIIDSIGPAFKRVFGGSFQDFLNLITLKLAVALEFVGRLVKTIFDGLGKYLGPIVDNIAAFAKNIWDLVEGFLSANREGQSLWTVLQDLSDLAGKVLQFITDLAVAFSKGLKDGLEGAMTPLHGIVEVLGQMVDLLIGADDKTKIFSKTMEGLGKIVGEVVVGALQAVWASLLGIKQGVMLTIAAIKVLSKVGKPEEAAQAQREMMDMIGGFGEEWKNFGEAFTGYWEKQGAGWARLLGINQRTKAPEVPAPTPGAGMRGRAAKERVIGLGPVTVNLSVASLIDARRAGEEFADGFRQSLLDKSVAGGEVG